MHNINLAIFNFINGGVGQYATLDHFLLFFTNNFTYAVCFVTTVYIVCWFPFRLRDITKRLHAFHQSIEYVFTTLSTWILIHIIKVVTSVPRPFTTLPSINVLSPYEGGYSFPSAHAAITIAIATTVYLHHKRLGFLLYCFAIVVAISRVYVGVHYPKDVIVGGLLGFAVAGLVHIGWCRMHTEK